MAVQYVQEHTVLIRHRVTPPGHDKPAVSYTVYAPDNRELVREVFKLFRDETDQLLSMRWQQTHRRKVEDTADVT